MTICLQGRASGRSHNAWTSVSVLSRCRWITDVRHVVNGGQVSGSAQVCYAASCFLLQSNQTCSRLKTPDKSQKRRTQDAAVATVLMGKPPVNTGGTNKVCCGSPHYGGTCSGAASQRSLRGALGVLF